MKVGELDTPVVVVDLDKLKANIDRAQKYFDQYKIRNRPHIKTHKIPAIAKMQMDAGAVGICCQKLGEAEIMVEAGFKDVFIPYNLVGETKLTRLTNLLSKANISVSADSAFTVEGLSQAAQNAGKELAVFVEFDSGIKRCGVQTPQDAAYIAMLIDKSPMLRFGGLMTYPTNDVTDKFSRETKKILASHNLSVDAVSGGGTNAIWQAHHHPEVTEHRAGMYIFGDRYTFTGGGVDLENIAIRVIATVVSRPTQTRGILDAGSKTLTSDLMGLVGHGLILEYPQAVIYGLSEEHGHVDFSECPSLPEIGERVSVIPNHCCPVVNLLDELIGIQNEEVKVVWPIVARGAVK